MKFHNLILMVKISVYILFLFIVFILVFSLFFPSHEFSLFFYPLFGFICHQEDILVPGTVKIPLLLCFRCSGIYLFLIIGALGVDIFFRKIDGHFHFFILIAGTLPLILDGFFHITGGLGIPFLSFLTGALFGGTCGAALMYGINGLLKKEEGR